MKAKGHSFQQDEKSNPYIPRCIATILESDESTTDEMSIQKTFKGAGTIMGAIDDLEKIYIPNAKDFSIEWFSKWFKKLNSCTQPRSCLVQW